MLVDLILTIIFGLIKIIIFTPVALILEVLKPVLGFLGSLNWITDITRPAVNLFSFLLENEILFKFILTTSVVLIPFEFAISVGWWILYKVPILGLKDK